MRVYDRLERVAVMKEELIETLLDVSLMLDMVTAYEEAIEAQKRVTKGISALGSKTLLDAHIEPSMSDIVLSETDRRYKHWTEDEVSVLMRYVSEGVGIEDMAQSLNRTVKGIASKLWTLGYRIKDSKAYRAV
jgi:hypothetical protein